MPQTMRAVRLDQIGPPENLKVVEREIPAVGDDDVLIEVEHAGLIYADAEARRGTYYNKTLLPWFPGREVAGRVHEVGRNIRNVAPGERVMALLISEGGYAEYALVSTVPRRRADGSAIPAGEILPLPDNVTSAQALIYIINFRLAHFLIHGWARLEAGAPVLVHGASGGMGSMVTALAAHAGCEVIALHRTAEEAKFCKENGATHCIDITARDYVDAVLSLTGSDGVHCSFNGVGGSTLHTDWRAVRRFGEIHAYGYVAGKPPLQLFDIHKSVAVKTFYANDFLRPPYLSAATEAMYDWFRTQPLHDVRAVFPLEQAPEAHRWLEEGRAIGKIALKP
jgi:NADPH2:quinone reductase